MILKELNRLPSSQAKAWFSRACAAEKWCRLMAGSRPFASVDALLEQAKTHWQSMLEADWLQAFEAHPMIGDVNSLKQKFASTRAMASHEQSGAQDADEEILEALAANNQRYFQQNGFIFIICATGLDAQTMLSALTTRLDNDRRTELLLAAEQQLNITLLRLSKGLQPVPEGS